MSTNYQAGFDFETGYGLSRIMIFLGKEPITDGHS
jgi:hypothetical protein